MYNMLQEDPYVFNDNIQSSSLQFMGVYITDLEVNKDKLHKYDIISE